jgi:hypothetical protein
VFECTFQRKDSGGNDSDDRKREMLERNRAAASRSRRRKKDQIKNVQELNSKLATSNKALIQVHSSTSHSNPRNNLICDVLFSNSFKVLTNNIDRSCTTKMYGMWRD